MEKEVIEKIRRCKALQGVSVLDVCMTERFMDNLKAYMKAQKDDRDAIRASYEAMHKLGGAKGYKLPAHPIDKVINISPGDMRDEYLRILKKECERPASEREYIRQLCLQAYSLTVAQIVAKEFPEIKDKLLPQSKQI